MTQSEQFNEAATALLAARDFATALLDTVAALVVVLDGQGRIEYFNPACRRLTGHSPSDMQGRYFWEVLIPPKEALGLRQVLRRLKEERITIRHQTTWVTREGSRRLIDWNSAAIALDGEAEVRLILTGLDVTERLQAALLLETSESLQRVTRALLRKRATPAELLTLICTEARSLSHAGGSALLLLEEERWLQVTANAGHPAPVVRRLPLANSLVDDVVVHGEPLLLNRPDENTPYRNASLHALLAVPLEIDGEVIGVLDAVNKPTGFTRDDRKILRLFADQAALAIENSRLQEQAEQLAITEERQRLARELHDSVTQALYSVSLYADATRLALGGGKVDTAAEHLHELRNMAREAMLDMRLLIFELHPPILQQEGLAAALQARLEAVEARSGLQTQFLVEGEERLPLSIEEELYRVAQEALTNAVKHARAREVVVHLALGPIRYELIIRDDGQGFNRHAAGHSGGMGLRNMSQRAARIGARFHVETTPGAGTILRIVGHRPVEEEET